MIDLLIEALQVGVTALGAVMVWYPSAILLGGKGQAGDELMIVVQMFFGFLILFTAHIHGVVW